MPCFSIDLTIRYRQDDSKAGDDEKRILTPANDNASVVSTSSNPTSCASSITLASSRHFFSDNEPARIARKLHGYCDRYGENLTITTKNGHYFKIEFESQQLGDKNATLQETLKELYSHFAGFQVQNKTITIPWNRLQDSQIQNFKATLTASADKLGLSPPLLETTLTLNMSAATNG